MTKSQHEELLHILMEQSMAIATIGAEVKAANQGISRLNGSVAAVTQRVNELEKSQAVDDTRSSRGWDVAKIFLAVAAGSLISPLLTRLLVGG